MSDPQRHLLRALCGRAARALAVERAASTPWASATFTGERHELDLRLPPDAARRVADGLEEHEFALPGHLVADIAVVAREWAGGDVRLRIEALTIEER